MNKTQLEGDWLRTKGKIREMWGDITDDELDKARGKEEQLVGLLKKKSGKAEEEIRRELERL